MASPNIWPGGLGGTSGASLATASRVYASGAVYFVGNTSAGSDSYAGTERNKPLATLAQANTNASAGDIIVLLSGHAESAAVSLTISKAGLIVVGEGSGTSRPSYTIAGTTAPLTVSGAGIIMDNIQFPASFSTTRLLVTGAGFWANNCKFTCGIAEAAPAALEFQTGAGQARIQDCEFVSSSTSITTQPVSGIKVTNAMTDLWMDNVTFDGGTSNWSANAFNGAAAITRLRAVNMRLLNGSDVTFATGTTGYFSEHDPSGSSRVVWTA